MWHFGKRRKIWLTLSWWKCELVQCEEVHFSDNYQNPLWSNNSASRTSTYRNPCTQANVLLKKTFAPTACEDTFWSWVFLSLGWNHEQIPWLHWMLSEFKSFWSCKSWNSFSNLKELSHNFRILAQPRLAPQCRHLSFLLPPSSSPSLPFH